MSAGRAGRKVLSTRSAGAGAGTAGARANGGSEQLSSDIGEPPQGQEKVGEDEHSELQRLRAEVSQLRAKGDSGGGSQGAARRRRLSWRVPVALLLIIFGCALAPIAVIGVWTANQVSNTDRYVANFSPLISDPAIQSALSARITTEIQNALDPRVKSATDAAAAELQKANLPRLSGLITNFSGQISDGLNSAIATGVSRAVASPAMATLWTQLLRLSHQAMVRVLSGQGGGAISVVNDQVVLNIGPIIAKAKDYLVTHGVAIAASIPAINATFPLFEAKNLSKAQQGYRLINTLKWVLPLLVLVLLAAGVYVARSHRRALIGAALGLSASMLLLGIALALARSIYLNSVPQSTLPSDAAAALYDTLIRFIRQGLRVILVVGLVIAVAAFFVGPSAAAVRSRRAVTSGIDWVRTRGEHAGVRTGPVGEWTGAHKTILRVAAVALVGVIFVFWGQPSVAVVIWLVVLLLVLLGLIELIGGRSGGTDTAPAANP